MPSSEDGLEDSASLSMEAMPYKTFLSDLSETSPALKIFQSLSLGHESHIDKSAAISRFSLLLGTLRVPGPCDLHLEISPLGRGAQFEVVKQKISGVVESTATPTFTSDMRVAAIKTPLFFLDGQQELDLSNPSVSRQVRNLIIEITALCHPSLRDHPNIVTLWGWGIKEEPERGMPFLALEVATNTLATFLCESRSAPIALKHHIALDIGCGVDALHEIGLIHGDLKPENVLMFYEAGQWVAKLADFGGGADTGQDGSLEGRGSIGWRAPELRQLFDNGTHIDQPLLHKIDNYSYGLLLWSLFLKDKAFPPCPESVEAEMVALSELETNPTLLPLSLQSVLKSSFSVLLKKDSNIRAEKVGHLLDDGSRVYSEWTLLRGYITETFPEDDTAVDLPQDNAIGYEWDIPAIQGNNIRYDWEIPEISYETFKAVRSEFSRNGYMTSEMIQSLFIKCVGSVPLYYYQDNRFRDFVLDLLYTGSMRGSQSLRALIYIVHEHFQIAPGADLDELKLLWMSEAVASGAFFLRKSLQYIDGTLLEESVRTFQYHGGYNGFYADFNRDSISELLMRTSNENVTHLNWKMTLNPRGDKLLHILSSTTTTEELRNVIKVMTRQEVNASNDFGETALYRACMAGVTANVLLLLSHGADPSIALSRGGPTCLHWLFHFSPQEVDVVARELITHGAPIHAQCEWRFPMPHYPFALPTGTPLHWAVENSAVEATRSLIHQGVDPSIRDGSDPYARDENVRFLDMRLPPDGKLYSVARHTTLGLSAIDVAVKNRDHEVLAILLSGITLFDPDDTDEEGYTAIHRLDTGEWRYTLQGSPIWSRLFQGSTISRADSLKKTIAILLQHGFNIDRFTSKKEPMQSAYGQSGQTALMIAVSLGNIETINQLLLAGADVNVANDEGETALMSFTDEYLRGRKDQSKAVSLLLHANANIHARDSSGETPLLMAASRGLFDVATALLDRGANLGDRKMRKVLGPFGQTVLAIIAGKAIKRGLRVEVDRLLADQLKTRVLPRIPATQDLDLRKELLEKADLTGGTLLQYTAEYGLLSSCAVLLEAKVSVNSIRTKELFNVPNRKRSVMVYDTALDRALEEGGKYYSIKAGNPAFEQERAELMKIFREIAKLLRRAGGLESRHLIAKQFGLPVDQDSRAQGDPLGQNSDGMK